MNLRAEVRHLIANRSQIITGHAQLIATDERVHPIAREKAKKIDREARRMLDDVMALFPEESAIKEQV